jgi:hypothetical protein
VNPERAICGLATIYGQRSANGDPAWSAEQFADFVASGFGVPVRLSHGPLITSRGAIRFIGAARKFVSVVYPTPGLLMLAELDDDPAGFNDELLADLSALNGHQYLPSCWGLSLGVTYTDELAWPYEVSICHEPAHEDAKILAVGAEAVRTWELLSPYQKVIS